MTYYALGTCRIAAAARRTKPPHREPELSRQIVRLHHND